MLTLSLSIRFVTRRSFRLRYPLYNKLCVEHRTYKIFILEEGGGTLHYSPVGIELVSAAHYNRIYSIIESQNSLIFSFNDQHYFKYLFRLTLTFHFNISNADV